MAGRYGWGCIAGAVVNDGMPEVGMSLWHVEMGKLFGTLSAKKFSGLDGSAGHGLYASGL